MKNKGCAFEIKGNGKSRYFSAPAVSGLADFARFLYENRAGAAGTPLPIRERIPQAEEISETAWQKIADHKAAGCACYFMLDIRENQVWSIRQGVVYKDLFFCNQVNGGDEWWTCRYDREAGAYFPFESVTMKAVIEKGEFETLLADMLAATVEQCKHLDYKGRSKEHE